MEQHPVPQPITSYEFRLVGDMTLRQFFKLAAGVILALIIYWINPPALLKWPLIFIFSLVGIGMAFFPFEGRPIDVWILAFFKRIYSPTQYVWKQRNAGNQTVPEKNPIQDQSIPTTANQPSVTTPVVSSTISSNIPPISPLTTPVVPPPPLRPKFVPPPPTPLARKVEAKFAPNITIPSTPTMANLLTGFIHDKTGKIIEGAILEIRDNSGNPVRAFRSNKLGQFLSATPLSSGLYEIETEKEGFSFDIIKVELKGEILSPIEIISK